MRGRLVLVRLPIVRSIENQKFVNNRKGVESKHLYERELETIVDYCLVLFVLLGFHYVVSSSGAAAK
jgi:hypothetical protein